MVEEEVEHPLLDIGQNKTYVVKSRLRKDLNGVYYHFRPLTSYGRYHHRGGVYFNPLSNFYLSLHDKRSGLWKIGGNFEGGLGNIAAFEAEESNWHCFIKNQWKEDVHFSLKQEYLAIDIQHQNGEIDEGFYLAKETRKALEGFFEDYDIPIEKYLIDLICEYTPPSRDNTMEISQTSINPYETSEKERKEYHKFVMTMTLLTAVYSLILAVVSAFYQQGFNRTGTFFFGFFLLVIMFAAITAAMGGVYSWKLTPTPERLILSCFTLFMFACLYLNFKLLSGRSMKTLTAALFLEILFWLPILLFNIHARHYPKRVELSQFKTFITVVMSNFKHETECKKELPLHEIKSISLVSRKCYCSIHQETVLVGLILIVLRQDAELRIEATEETLEILRNMDWPEYTETKLEYPVSDTQDTFTIRDINDRKTNLVVRTALVS